MATDTKTYNLFFYDANSDETESINKESSTSEVFFGVCIYDKANQPSAPGGFTTGLAPVSNN